MAQKNAGANPMGLPSPRTTFSLIFSFLQYIGSKTRPKKESLFLVEKGSETARGREIFQVFQLEANKFPLEDISCIDI